MRISLGGREPTPTSPKSQMAKDFQMNYSLLLLLAIFVASGAFTPDSGLRVLGQASFILPQVVRTSRAGSSVRQLEPHEWTVVVSATERWFDTGIKVPSGGLLMITAGGVVTWAPPGGRNMSSTVGPNGTRPPFPQDSPRFPVPDAGCGSLVMRIGSSVLAVGEAGTIEVDNGGTVQLMVNDDVLSDNSGTFDVRIKLIEPSQHMTRSLIAPLPEGAYDSAQGFKGTTLDPKLFHLGKDYCVDASGDPRGVVLRGTRFYAIGSGKVIDLRFSEPAYRKDGVGNYIIVDHGNSLIAVYMHLAKVFVKRGQDVDSNTPLGEAGDVILHPKPNCGHLHLEIRNDGVTSLNVPPNLRYSYASRDGKTRYSRPFGDERAVNTWIDANFLDPEHTLSPRDANSRRTNVMPPIPYEDNGACPFEGCTYRAWTATTQTAILSDRRDGAPVIFTVKKGEKVTGLTGVVITIVPGEVKVLKPVVVDGSPVRPGETIYLLHYEGEGFYKVWYMGKIAIPEMGDSDVKFVRKPETVWWVKIRNGRDKSVGLSKQKISAAWANSIRPIEDRGPKRVRHLLTSGFLLIARAFSIDNRL